MIQSKKLVLGTQRAFDKAVDEHAVKGWVLAGSEVIPRGNTGKSTYIAYFKKEKP